VTARVNASGDTLARIRELEAELAVYHDAEPIWRARAEKAKARVAELEARFQEQRLEAMRIDVLRQNAEGWLRDCQSAMGELERELAAKHAKHDAEMAFKGEAREREAD